MALNLFPVRAPIGRGMVNGQPVDILMTPEFARALADLLVRVGGPSGNEADQMAAMAMFEPTPAARSSNATTGDLMAPVDPSAQIAALVKTVSALRSEIAALPVYMTMRRDIDDLRRQLGIIEDPGAAVRYLQRRKQNTIVKGTATGSRAGNAALASLLTALATSGLVIDTTTP